MDESGSTVVANMVETDSERFVFGQSNENLDKVCRIRFGHGFEGNYIFLLASPFVFTLHYFYVLCNFCSLYTIFSFTAWASSKRLIRVPCRRGGQSKYISRRW